MTELIGKGGIMIPLWAACLAFLAAIVGPILAGVFMLRGKKLDGPQQALTSLLNNAPALLTKAQELLTANERLQSEKRERDEQIEELGESVKELTGKVAALDETVGRLTAQADKVPVLQAENEGLRAQIRDRDEEIARLTIERDVALRAQERAEGGLRATRQTIRDISCAEDGPHQDAAPFQGPETTPRTETLRTETRRTETEAVHGNGSGISH